MTDPTPVVRPLPQLAPANAWFWSSGADRHLHIQGCTDCSALVHPPTPICPICRSRAWEPQVVSGRHGRRIHRQPPAVASRFPAAYAVANVALEEDPTVHLTTNVVGCEPDEVRIGQQVTVRFEHREDVWLPLFVPTGDPIGDGLVVEPARPRPRAPLTDDRFEHRAVLSGIGRSAIGRRLMVDPLSLAVDAGLAAVAPSDDVPVRFLARENGPLQLPVTIERMTDEPVADPAPTSWREVAVARSLDPARVRAEKRVQRFLDAAVELMTSSSEKEFTVQEVVERSGQSLRSFYQYFAGKHELLLALFEEAVRSTAERLATVAEDEADPLERLRLFADEYYRLCRPGDGASTGDTPPASVMAEFAQQLLTQHPKEAAQAFVPLVALCGQLLDDAAAAGAIRGGLDHRQITGVVLQAVMFNAFADTISGTPVRSDAGAAAAGLWDLLLNGLSTDA